MKLLRLILTAGIACAISACGGNGGIHIESPELLNGAAEPQPVDDTKSAPADVEATDGDAGATPADVEAANGDAESAEAGQAPSETVIEVSADGAITVDGREMTLDELEHDIIIPEAAKWRTLVEDQTATRSVSEKPILIAADQDTQFNILQQIMARCVKHGIYRISFKATLPVEDEAEKELEIVDLELPKDTGPPTSRSPSEDHLEVIEPGQLPAGQPLPPGIMEELIVRVRLTTVGRTYFQMGELTFSEIKPLEDHLKKLHALAPNQPLAIAPELKVRYNDVIAVLDTCKRIGYTNVSFTAPLPDLILKPGEEHRQ